MSRAKKIVLPNDEDKWYDSRTLGSPAEPELLELLADIDNISLDELLEQGLSRSEAYDKLRKALGQGGIPEEVLKQREKRRKTQNAPAECRICNSWQPTNGCEGRITKHHFVPKWCMKELENYQAYSTRQICTIPLHLNVHRDLHLRNSGANKSVYHLLKPDERELAHKMLTEFREQHPVIFEIQLAGDIEVYEACLVNDFIHGKFR